jgi:uncharacterized protein (DUF58 family)
MKKIQYIADLFLAKRFFYAVAICILLFIASFYILILWPVAIMAVFVFCIFVLLDYFLLFGSKKNVEAYRIVEPKFSNGDNNNVGIAIKNNFNFKVAIQLIDEIPFAFQLRDLEIKSTLHGFEKKQFNYYLKPVERGEYSFGNILIYTTSPIGFIQRKFVHISKDVVKVFPSFLQLRNQSIVGLANEQNVGENKVHRLANSMEFDHIKEYTLGDDSRTINWKASARNTQLMVNTYTEERSQQIYCVIDMGRIMKMPFENMSLLDYSINSALMLSYTILQRNDKAGIITFNHQLNEVLVASKLKTQLGKIAETLYKLQTNFLESNYEALMAGIRHHVGQRSLLMLYTNFETSSSLERHLPYLKAIAKKHLLCVVIFENTELSKLQNKPADSLEKIYTKTMAERFDFEKRRIMKELQQQGISSIFTTPQNLSTDTINHYLDLKRKRII